MEFALNEWLGALVCPLCSAGFSSDNRVFRCDNGHCFDIARQGYLNLLNHGAPANADTPAMLTARSRFLDSGHYSPIADAIAELVPVAGSRILEVGSGTGYYLNRVLAAVPACGLATDISTAAAKHAARNGLAAIVADTWAGLPLADNSIDVLLCIFAPRNPVEFARVLKPHRAALIAYPGEKHLVEAREEFGLLGIQPGKSEKIDREMLAAGFRRQAARTVEYRIDLTASELSDLVAMGPNAFHGNRAPEANMPVSVNVEVVSYQS